MFTQAHPNEGKRETQEESSKEKRSRQRTEAKRFVVPGAPLAVSTLSHHSDRALQPSLQHPSLTPPLALQALAAENEEKRRGGFRASLFPLFLLNFSANISAV